MSSASNVIARKGRHHHRTTPLAGRSLKDIPNAAPQGAQLASLTPEGRYPAFYKAQLRVAVFDDFAAFSGGIHKYADHVASRLLHTHACTPIKSFQEAWVQSPDMASHPFHGRNLRNFFVGKDSAHGIWAVLDLYIKITNPKLAAGFHVERYLERLGLTVGEFAKAAVYPAQAQERLLALSPSAHEHIQESVHLQPLVERRFGLAKLIRKWTDEVDHSGFGIPAALDDRRCAVGLGVIVPLKVGDVLLVKDPDTEDILMGRFEQDNERVTLLSDSGARSLSLSPADKADLPADILSGWMENDQ
ncbi:MAG: hypothetical protein AAF317_04855 [Pseudomonadota bacterium]